MCPGLHSRSREHPTCNVVSFPSGEPSVNVSCLISTGVPGPGQPDGPEAAGHAAERPSRPDSVLTAAAGSARLPLALRAAVVSAALARDTYHWMATSSESRFNTLCSDRQSYFGGHWCLLVSNISSGEPKLHEYALFKPFQISGGHSEAPSRRITLLSMAGILPICCLAGTCDHRQVQM